MKYIEIGLPMVIAFLGWIVVHNLNKKYGGRKEISFKVGSL